MVQLGLFHRWFQRAGNASRLLNSESEEAKRIDMFPASEATVVSLKACFSAFGTADFAQGDGSRQK